LISGDNLPSADREPQAKEIRPSEGFNQNYPDLREDKKMKSMAKVIMLLALALVICLPGMASALTQGWTWDFTLDPLPNSVDTLEGFIVLPSSATFATPGFDMSAYSGWTNFLVNPQYAFATGPGHTNFASQFNTNFTDTVPAGTYMDWYAYSGGINGTVVEEWRQLVGSPTDFVAITIPRDDPSHNLVPLPPTALLLGSGLLGLVGLRRFRKS
jgi:hypothetical protein